MYEETILDFCNHLYGILNIPISYYENNMISSTPSYNTLDYLLVKPYEKDLLSSKDILSFLVTSEYMYYGIVKIKNTNSSIIIGPISSTKPNSNTLKSILSSLKNASVTSLDLKYYFDNHALISFEKFLKILCFINFLCNNDNLTTDDIFGYKNKNYESYISKAYTKSSYESKENENMHNTYQFEQLYLSYIEKGDLNGLNKLLRNKVNLNAGIIALDNIRQSKNIFVTSATLITRAAIKGGLEIETAYQLSDTYIQQMEHLNDITLINNLASQMMYDFTERVTSTKLPDKVSNIVYKCIQYISTKTNENITVSDVADHVNRSRSFISRTFKSEMNIELSTYIMTKKLEESEGLLKFTDKSISEISNYLCFSSQSYFQNVFKKNYNLTPNEYRKKYAK